MATTQLQRIMFLQGRLCFFCNRTIPKSEASVEHLVPASAGGSDNPDNLVACCKTLNALFGRMNVKDKLRAILKTERKVCLSQSANAAAAATQGKATSFNANSEMTATPNHALQRTAPRVTVAAISCPGVFTPSHFSS